MSGGGRARITHRQSGKCSFQVLLNAGSHLGGLTDRDADAPEIHPLRGDYLREPRATFFSFVWRIFSFLRLGLVMLNVPLPRYSAL